MEAFSQFLQDQQTALRRIARHTRGEHTHEDVVQEAWLMAGQVADHAGREVDFSCPDFLQLLLSHLYQHLVRWTELNVRHGVRLDHSAHPDADEDAPHPMLTRLASDGGADRLSCLISREEESHEPRMPADVLHSSAHAYVTLIEHFDRQMSSVARHLLISRSYAYRCWARARHLASTQRSLALLPAPPATALSAWRRWRVDRAPRQMAFDFDDPLPLPQPAS